MAGPACRFIISAWISDIDIFDKSDGWRSDSGEGVDFLPHCFQASSSSSSTTSSRSSVMWTFRLDASATRTNTGLLEMSKDKDPERRRRRRKVTWFGMVFFCEEPSKSRDRKGSLGNMYVSEQGERILNCAPEAHGRVNHPGDMNILLRYYYNICLWSTCNSV